MTTTATFQAKLIDLERLIESKNPRLLKLLPGVVLNYIKKVIHQHQINDFIARHNHQYGLDFARSIIRFFEVNVLSTGNHNIPVNGGCIFASNHPLGGLDAIALLTETGKVRTDLKFLVNDILMHLKNFESIFVPVNKLGKNSVTTIEQIEKVYASEEAVLVFPAGLVSRKQKGKVKDLEWKKSFVTRARKHQKPIVPVFIDGKNSDFFYGLSRWRKLIGIKANIEMFYLVDEMFEQKNKTISIVFGKPILPEVFEQKHSDHVWAEKIKEHVYLLGHTRNPDVQFKF